jgi:hypothetical protein
MKNSLPAVALLLSDARGIYIPRVFVQNFDLSKWEGITPENIAECSDPDNTSYWSAWEEILQDATFTENGNVWRLSQDGDLWALCAELMTNEEKENFGFDVDGEPIDANEGYDENGMQKGAK